MMANLDLEMSTPRRGQVLHSEMEWERVSSSTVMADHGSGLMNLTPQRTGDRARDAYGADQCGRGQQPTDGRSR